METIVKEDSIPVLPPPLKGLGELAANLWWTWHPEVVDLWRTIDSQLWRESRHSPIAFLKRLGNERLHTLSRDPALLIRLHQLTSDLNRYLAAANTWNSSKVMPLRARPVAYFCAEFGIHESLPLYSGGLGVLSGDHLKSASDLGVPLVGVSLFYREGYFRQALSEDGDQAEAYERFDPEDLGLRRLQDKDGKPLLVEIPIGDESVQVGAWVAHLGRIPLYFLDMEVAFRKMGIQDLGLRLYGGDEEVRLMQEMILGIAGMRFLLRIGIEPGVIHLNEGHCAFAAIEYARHLMEEHGIPFEVARGQAGSRTVFTTHTPVPAGHDRFSSDLLGRMIWKYRESLGLTHEQFMDLGRVRPGNTSEPFVMTVLALRTASKANAVSSIHARVSRLMWADLWPDRPPPEVPIGHITNGINILGWLAPSMKELFHRYFPPDWQNRTGEEGIWLHIHTIPDEELWGTVLLLKTRLLEFLPRSPSRSHPQSPQFDPNALTIGFARRFAGYKRAHLLLDEPDRLRRILTNPQRPVQMLFSGKAHPRDVPAKELIKGVYRFINDPASGGRVAFIEDYDINVCRHLVQGVDVWLNTPVQGQEACGTSGMKVALNGGLHFSILDGWWPEGYDGTNGFAVRGARNLNPQIRDAHDREALFKALEEEVIPLYYERDGGGIPRGWIRRMKQAMCTLGWRFSSDRMVMDYVLHCYSQAAGITTCQMNTPFV